MLLAAGALWGTAGIFVKALSGMGADSLLISFCRVLPAFLILLVITLVRLGPGALRIPGKALFICALTGFVCQFLFNYCYSTAIETIGMSFSSVLLYMAPVSTAVTACIFFKEKMNAVKALALAVNIAGCVLTVTGGSITGVSLPVTGILAGLGAAFFYSMAAIFGRLAVSGTDPLVTTTLVFFFASLFSTAFVRPSAFAAVISPEFIIVILLYALLPTAAAYLIYFSALRHVHESGRVPVITSVEPVVATILGIAVFSEPLGAANCLGIALVIFSIVLMNAKFSFKTCPGGEEII